MRCPIIVRTEGKKEPIVFFPGQSANYGFICFFTRNEGHGEASVEYYLRTKKADVDQTENMLKYYQNYSDSIEPGIEYYAMKRLSTNLLWKAWRGA